MTAVDASIERRAAVHAALGEPVRLAIVEDLRTSDRAPTDLATRHGLPGNLLAHHLDVLERVGLIERRVSTGDRRRRYVRLRPEVLHVLGRASHLPRGRALFICTHNSARSQLAAALWRDRTGDQADSAGTHPGNRVHPGAITAAKRAGIDISGARPRALQPGDTDVDLVVTVCDRAHEELDVASDWLHWSIPDPVDGARVRAFDTTLVELDERIAAISLGQPDQPLRSR